MGEKVIGYFCSKHGFYKDAPFICEVCGLEAKEHIVVDKAHTLPSKRYDNIYVYVNKMNEATQANARQLIERGY